nr:integrase [Streptomyces sp. SID4948]
MHAATAHVTALARNLVIVPVSLLRSRVAKDAEVLALRHEKPVLRRQIARVHYGPADRIRLTTFSRLVPRGRWRQVFAVTPTTLLRWHRELCGPELEQSHSGASAASGRAAADGPPTIARTPPRWPGRHVVSGGWWPG